MKRTLCLLLAALLCLSMLTGCAAKKPVSAPAQASPEPAAVPVEEKEEAAAPVEEAPEEASPEETPAEEAAPAEKPYVEPTDVREGLWDSGYAPREWAAWSSNRSSVLP